MTTDVQASRQRGGASLQAVALARLAAVRVWGNVGGPGIHGVLVMPTVGCPGYLSCLPRQCCLAPAAAHMQPAPASMPSIGEGAASLPVFQDTWTADQWLSGSLQPLQLLWRRHILTA